MKNTRYLNRILSTNITNDLKVHINYHLQDGAKCPYFVEHDKSYIRCRRGLVKKRTFKLNLALYRDKHCNGNYTDCSIYKELNRAW